jgi:hypothetical protein
MIKSSSPGIAWERGFQNAGINQRLYLAIVIVYSDMHPIFAEQSNGWLNF